MRRHSEFFWVQSCRRVYDRAHAKFFFNISYSTAVRLSPRTIAVAEAFGLGIDEEVKFTVLDVELRVGPTDVVYVTGDSGSGKSVLLRAIKKDLADDAIDVADIQVDWEKPLIETIGSTVEEGLELLSKVGLNDAFLFLRSFDQLSDGQKYRYRIAKLLESKARFWILDEFAATLDRDTAKIVAFNLQKCARQRGRAVLVATTHRDLFEDLAPDVHVHKRFGKEIAVNYVSRTGALDECSLVREMHVEEASTKEWRSLAPFHYRSHRIPAPRKIFSLRRDEELCGVIVYSYPPSTCFGRRLMLPKMGMKEVNELLSNISRVVVHPKYRSIGLGSKLIRETLSLAGTNCVEMTAVMAKYNPFAEKAGMQKIVLQQPPKEALKIKALLESLGFELQFLNSLKYVSQRLASLSGEDVLKVREVFVKCRHPRFSKSLSYHLPFGTKAAYEKQIGTASLEKLAELIRVCSFLLQTKAYLFWRALERSNGHIPRPTGDAIS
jgi:ABC-type transport system involved in cytochrome c biogenesis ATPase subunit/GNAT superfamily N-acetyltransferase